MTDDDFLEVYVVSTVYEEYGVEKYQVNCVYRDEEKANKLCEWIKEHPLEDGKVFAKEVMVNKMCIL